MKAFYPFCVCLFLSRAALAANFGVIATPSPQATAAGERVLKAGGTAADAAIAAALVLGVVAPESSGLGGGGVFLYYNKSQNQFSDFDYLESLPSDAVVSQKNSEAITLVGVPGVVAGFEKIHERFGKLPWNTLFDEAIQLADDGFLPSAAWRARLQQVAEGSFGDDDFRSFFGDVWISDDAPLKQEALADTLKTIRDQGATAFYRGVLNEKILKELSEKKSTLSAAEWNFYDVLVGVPTQFYFKNLKITVPAESTQGGVFLDELLRAVRVAKIKSTDSGFPHFIEKSVRKFFTAVPTLQKVPSIKSGYGVQISVVDAQGNMASVQNTLHGYFGSGVYLKETGLLLNATGLQPRVAELLKADTVFNLGSRQKRSVDFLLPVIMTRGFDESFVFGTSGGVTAPQNLFQIIYKMQSEQQALAAAIKAPKFYHLPNEKQNLYEKKFPAKQLKAKLDAPVQLSPFEIGRVEAVEVSRGQVRVVDDLRQDRAVKVPQRKIKTVHQKAQEKEIKKENSAPSPAPAAVAPEAKALPDTPSLTTHSR